MLEDIVTDKKLINQPIVTPDNPYIASLKDFGADELLAGGVDIGSTALVAHLASGPFRNAFLPFVGPVVEKGIFFVRHLHQARELYKTVPKSVRQPFSFYLKQGLRDGSDNLLKDLMFHDPMYIAFMASGLEAFPDTPPFLLSMASYVTAVLAVAGIDVAKNEIRYRMKKRDLEKMGFQSEKYYESRFFVGSEKKPAEVMESFMKEFGLNNVVTNHYKDIYFESKLPSFNGRKPKTRIRSRDNSDQGKLNSLQIVYSRARENNQGLDQVRYFITEKEKIYKILNEPIETITEAPKEIKPFLEKAVAPNPHYSALNFTRTCCNNEQLSMCTDNVAHRRPFYLIELKSWKNEELMKQAMRYLMVECPIVSIQTTHGKR
jgi:hypothetical protein